MYVLAIVEDVA